VITAVDTNILFDVFTADATFGAASRAALTRCLREGALIACDAVWAEIAAGFRSEEPLNRDMEMLGVRYVPIDQPAAVSAGQAWRAYRDAGGTRRRILADFLIGGHALRHADWLLTRDRGFYRRHFEALEILDPSE